MIIPVEILSNHESNLYQDYKCISQGTLSRPVEIIVKSNSEEKSKIKKWVGQLNKQNLFVYFLLMIFLVGCSSNAQGTGTLNDKNLKLQDHPKGTYPRYYDAVSKEEAKKALPFTIKLPDKFPFKVALSTFQISDWGEKRNILLDSVFYPKQEGKNVYIAYHISNFLPNSEKLETGEKVKLEDGTKAYFSGSADLPILAWKESGLYHKIEYLKKEETESKKAKSDLLKAASSIYE
jgi:hypothetical protein